VLVFISSLYLFSQGLAAQLPFWHVQPTICIRPSDTELCRLTLIIQQEGLAQGQYCLFLSQQQLRCVDDNQFPLSLEVSLAGSNRLLLLDPSENVILSAELEVKSQQSNAQRRRLRSPWSIF
jgi:hypothetical protein